MDHHLVEREGALPVHGSELAVDDFQIGGREDGTPGARRRDSKRALLAAASSTAGPTPV
jgi:hypothetical protein